MILSCHVCKVVTVIGGRCSCPGKFCIVLHFSVCVWHKLHFLFPGLVNVPNRYSHVLKACDACADMGQL